ncbi:DUF2304 domain-containing protein [Patescibacteria group bacterium]|nr:DUF2304 domain-containing protein [Patescibacteria group bacterium]
MTIFQIIILILIAIVCFKAVRKLLKKEISFLLFASWIGLWLIVALIAIFPSIVNRLADFVGIGRGVDLIIYLSIISLFYMLFKINLRQNKIEKNISELVRKIAMENYHDGKTKDDV